jgi:HEPN domain-containing protein
MDRLTSMGISNEAQNFLEAAKILRANTNEIFTPTYFAICQSIELSIKGFLRGSGHSEPSLRKIGHDLINGIVEAQRAGLEKHCELSEQDAFIIEKINPYYQGKDLQYSKTGYKSYARVDLLIEFGERLWKNTRQFCEDNREWHEGKESEVP